MPWLMFFQKSLWFIPQCDDGSLSVIVVFIVFRINSYSLEAIKNLKSDKSCDQICEHDRKWPQISISNITFSSVVGQIWISLDSVFSGYHGEKAMIFYEFYGLKNAGAPFQHHKADCMKHLCNTACIVNPFVGEVWSQSW